MDIKESNQNNVLCIQEEKDKRESFQRSAGSKKYITIIDQDFHQKSGLSLEAMGLIGYLMSLPEGWIVYISHLQKVFKIGRDKLRKIMKELKQKGYMQRIPIKNSKGRIVTWKTQYSDQPEFLRLVQMTENPSPGNPCPGKQPLQINNNTKETNYKKTTQQEIEATRIQDSGVVVSMMEKLKELVVSKVLVKRWLKQHGVEYVMEKVNYTLSANRMNPAAFLNLAIREDWKAPLTLESPNNEKQPSEPIWPSHEENIEWYSSLSEEDKKGCFKFALTKHAQFGNILDLNGLSFLGQDFIGSTWFKMMMSLIGRAK